MEFPIQDCGDDQTIQNFCKDRHVTEEEFQNFMQRVVQVEDIVRKLASPHIVEQERGKILADQILENKNSDGFELLCENEELKTKTNRTVINKYYSQDQGTHDANKMSQEIFMKTMEQDARERAEDRKKRNERADTYKKIGNGAFSNCNYEKAVTYYGKAIEQRKDSAVIWNNRALSFMKLGLYEKALQDCEWALKVNDSNIKALLNSAKCYAYLGDHEKRDEFLKLAKERIPKFSKYIEDFEKALKQNPNNQDNQEEESVV